MVTSCIGTANKNENLQDVGEETTSERQGMRVFVSDVLSSNSDTSIPLPQMPKGNWMRRAGAVVERIGARVWWLVSGMLGRAT